MNWSIGELERLIYADSRVSEDTPLREIEIKNRTTILVSLGDYGPMSGGGEIVTLSLVDGRWKIVHVEPFES